MFIKDPNKQIEFFKKLQFTKNCCGRMREEKKQTKKGQTQ